MNFEGWGPQRWAIHFNQMLNLAAPPNRYRFDVGRLAMETSQAMFPGDPITKVQEEDLDGFAGSLVPAESRTRWGIAFGRGQSDGRRRFTVAHEFGHFLLHRKKYPNGIHSSEAGVDGRTKLAVEREANEFASWLLMPLDDFRKQIAPREKPDFEAIGACADRYEVSLVAAALRWLRYTDRRAVLVTSVDGFVKWAWSSEPAYKSGIYIRTTRGPVELPRGSAVAQELFTPEVRAGIDHPVDIWLISPLESTPSKARNTTRLSRCCICRTPNRSHGTKGSRCRTPTRGSSARADSGPKPSGRLSLATGDIVRARRLLSIAY